MAGYERLGEQQLTKDYPAPKRGSWCCCSHRGGSASLESDRGRAKTKSKMKNIKEFFCFKFFSFF